jgi:hypothetical protein
MHLHTVKNPPHQPLGSAIGRGGIDPVARYRKEAEWGRAIFRKQKTGRMKIIRPARMAG